MARKLKSQGQVLSGSPSSQFKNFSPKPIQANRAPTTADTGYEIGQLWADTTGTTMYGLSAVGGGLATWNLLGPGSSDVDTLGASSGDTTVSPTGGKITLIAGTNIATVGATPGSITIATVDDPSFATSVSSPIFTASGTATTVAAAATENIVLKMGNTDGSTKVSFTNSSDAEVFSIDDQGALDTLSGLTNTGTFTTSGGTASINASSNFNTVINSGTSSGTVTIGNSAAGAISLDTSAGISLDSATASNFTVTGAADLTVASTTGSVVINGGEAAASDAISLTASGLAGGITLSASTGSILVGNQAGCETIDLGNIAPTGTRNITIGSGTVATASVTDTISIAAGGVSTNVDSVKSVLINDGDCAVGQVLTNIGIGAVTSGLHEVNLQTGNVGGGTVTTNISTGTGVKTINLGNADANTSININGITAINASVNAATNINTGTSTGVVTIGNAANTTSVAIASSGAASFTGAGTVTVGSTAGTTDFAVASTAINIGSGGVSAPITIATSSTIDLECGTGGINVGSNATAHATTIGSTNTTSSTVIQAGTGEITFTGTVKEISAEFLEASGANISTISSNPIMTTAANTGGAATGTTGATNLMSMQNGIIMEQFILGAGQTIIAPRIDANGLLISLDLTASEGAEYNFGPRNLSPYAFTIGTSDPFFFEVGLYINDMDGAAPYVIGFRKVEANNATFSSYTDYASIGMIAASSTTNIVTATELNGGGQTVTDTTDAWGGDGATKTLRVLVSGAGVVTYTIDGVAPTASAAFTFDNADVVIPFIRVEHSANPTQVDITSLKVGFTA